MSLCQRKPSTAARQDHISWKSNIWSLQESSWSCPQEGHLTRAPFTQNVSAYLLGTCVPFSSPGMRVCAHTCKCDVVSTTNAHPHLHAGIPGDDRTSFIITSSQKVILVFYAQSFLPLFIGYFTHQRTRGWGAHTRTHTHTPMLRARRRE